MIFQNPFHDEFGCMPLCYAPFGGADYGEVLAVAQAVAGGDDCAFLSAWAAAGDRLAAKAEDALGHGRVHTGASLLLKASCFFSTSYRPIYGEPVDARLVACHRKCTNALERGLALLSPKAASVRIPYQGTTLPAHFIPAQDYPNSVRPLVIFTNGYDATMADMYFASAVSASRRGYHTLIFDGPGQGELLIEHGVRLRHDWENVITPVVDFALTLPIVDASRIALSGWSLGGYLAARAATQEHRLCACIVDPGLWSVAGGFQESAIKLGATPQEAQNLGMLDDSILDKMHAVITGNRRLTWSVMQRGYWVHGVANLRDYLRSVERFTLQDRAELIQCPTLITAAGNDSLSSSAPRLFDALQCPKTLLRFEAFEGAGEHCELRNRTLLNLRTLDWLDDVMSFRH